MKKLKIICSDSSDWIEQYPSKILVGGSNPSRNATGEMAERLNATVLKTVEVRTSVSSNLTLSTKIFT